MKRICHGILYISNVLALIMTLHGGEFVLCICLAVSGGIVIIPSITNESCNPSVLVGLPSLKEAARYTDNQAMKNENEEIKSRIKNK